MSTQLIYLSTGNAWNKFFEKPKPKKLRRRARGRKYFNANGKVSGPAALQTSL